MLLLGQPLPADLPPAVALDSQSILADIPAGLPSDLLTRRPDIMQAEATLRGANANIGAARAAFFPTISLTGALGSASSALGGLFKAGSLAWSFLPSITMPIFQGGQLQASLDVATLQKDINIAQYEKAIQTAFREVADGLAARGTYDDELAALVRYTEAQQRSLDLSELRFKNGVDNYLAVLTAQTALVQRAVDDGEHAPRAPHQPGRSVPGLGRRLDRAHGRCAASCRGCRVGRVAESLAVEAPRDGRARTHGEGELALTRAIDASPRNGA